MVCDLVVGALGAGSLFLGWACATRGWTPMAGMAVLTALFCAVLTGATAGPVVAGALSVLVLGVGWWVMFKVKPAAGVGGATPEVSKDGPIAVQS